MPRLARQPIYVPKEKYIKIANEYSKVFRHEYGIDVSYDKLANDIVNNAFLAFINNAPFIKSEKEYNKFMHNLRNFKLY